MHNENASVTVRYDPDTNAYVTVRCVMARAIIRTDYGAARASISPISDRLRRGYGPENKALTDAETDGRTDPATDIDAGLR